jgi:hypothetical protein
VNEVKFENTVLVSWENGGEIVQIVHLNLPQRYYKNANGGKRPLLSIPTSSLILPPKMTYRRRFTELDGGDADGAAGRLMLDAGSILDTILKAWCLVLGFAINISLFS